ncbi:uncharacterized protein LOC110429870 [Sorghum bicolor]|uniref:Uncharacterized protein n=1 Tax=Sorghum bicolor TaxID=4558 RepID=A0A1B6PDL0_SORBI|nr:uncharacterized protein LOC110429870 [Sorghum bicolor]KXG23764.1 hypothetical protein SORBI_3008G137100 [Sorghum bicolor]|eukprot:XP_021302242.1 uncharacterized protein LOC110429870 [Sorghum bicolor]
MGGTYLPLAALVLATAVTLLVATSAVPVAAAAANNNKYYSGRMVIIRAPGATTVVVSAGGALNKWRRQQQRRRRLVEDEVAPEFVGLLGAGNGGQVSYNAENKDRPVCLPDGSCAARGGSYTRPCTYKDHCPH